MGSLKKCPLIWSSRLASYSKHIQEYTHISEELYYTEDILQLKLKKDKKFSSIKENKILLIIVVTKGFVNCNCYISEKFLH